MKVSKEVISYGFWGVVTTLENIILYSFLLFLGTDYKMANIITLIIVKVTAYIVNKFFVFNSKTETMVEFIQEFYRFFLSRMITFWIDFFGLILLVEVFELHTIFSKVFLSAIVILLNYTLGKKHVFKTNEKGV